jgi:hypothetical protein
MPKLDHPILEQIVRELHQKMVEALRDRNGRACSHVTLRPPYLPCPHPDCYPKEAGVRFPLVVERTPERVDYRYMAEESLPPMEQEVWWRAKMDLGDQGLIYAWLKEPSRSKPAPH